MVRATYDNVIVGDVLLLKDAHRDHSDTVVRKYWKGNPALVIKCSEGAMSEFVVWPNELSSWGFQIPLGPPKPITDDRRAMEYGPYSIFSIEREINGKFENFDFILHHGCRECEANYQRMMTMSGVGYVPHRASQMCRSGKRPHCTCDTCF